jgi:AraC family transcriptional regulator, transcriptional activator FtrA
MHSVAILAYDGMSGFESGLAAEIFGITELSEMFSAGIARPWYSVKLCAQTPEVRMLGGATVRARYGLADLAAADTVVIPSVQDVAKPTSPKLVDAIRSANERKSRLVSICSGVFALAAAGVLDGRRATTHWIYTDLLQQRYPRSMWIRRRSTSTKEMCSPAPVAQPAWICVYTSCGQTMESESPTMSPGGW